MAGANSNGVGAQVVHFTSNGKIDRAFGHHGVLRIESVSGSEFRPSAIAIDALGRIILAGNIGIREHAVVLRLQQDGSPDPTFGDGEGLVYPKFRIPQYTFSSTDPTPPQESPVSINTVAVDQSGRIVVSGSAARYYGGYCLRIRSGVVARLEPQGSIDASFGDGGTVVYEPDVIDSVAGFTLDASGGPLLWGIGENCRETPTGGWQIARLSLAGTPDPSFGEEGHVALAGGPAAVAVDRHGNVLILGSNSVRRLKTDGQLDWRFGNHGVAGLPQRVDFDDLAITPTGVVLAVGIQARYHGSDISVRRLALAALTSRGRRPRHFGVNGFVRLRSRKKIESTGQQIMIDAKDRAIVAGTTRDRRLVTKQGLVLYRFDLAGR